MKDFLKRKNKSIRRKIEQKSPEYVGNLLELMIDKKKRLNTAERRMQYGKME